MQTAEHNEENSLLTVLKGTERGVTQAELTRHLGWKTKAGAPNRQKVNRIVGRMTKLKFIAESRGRLTLTDKGRKEIDE
jgi:hypothetical protein